MERDDRANRPGGLSKKAAAPSPEPPAFTQLTSGVENIAGLREQILANAVHWFPSIVENHIIREAGNKNIKPSEAFDIVVCAEEKGFDLHPTQPLTAVLTYGRPAFRKIAAAGAKATTVDGALLSLLFYSGKVALNRLQKHKSVDLWPGEPDVDVEVAEGKLLKKDLQRESTKQ